jgi:alpha-tubulin suppressor-like RCC1 family protein
MKLIDYVEMEKNVHRAHWFFDSSFISLIQNKTRKMKFFLLPQISPNSLDPSAFNQDTITRAALGHAHTLVQTKGGLTFAFGAGTFGQLGLTDNKNRTVPMRVETLGART